MVDDQSVATETAATQSQVQRINTKRRKLENGDEEDELQIADEEEETPDKATVQEEVMEEGGDLPYPPPLIVHTDMPRQHNATTNPPPPLQLFNPKTSPPFQQSPGSYQQSPSYQSSPGLQPSLPSPLPQSFAQSLPSPLPQLQPSAFTSTSPQLSNAALNNAVAQAQLKQNALQQICNVTNEAAMFNNVNPAGLPGGLPGPIPGSPMNSAQALTAQVLIENLFAQVLAHSITQAPPVAESLTVPITTLAQLSTETHITSSLEDVKPVIVTQEEAPVDASTLQDTLDKVNVLEASGEELDKKGEDLKQLVSDVVRRQEEILPTPGCVVCPRCKATLESGAQFIAHLETAHSFGDRAPSADFQSQAGLGTCRGWRYLRTRNSGTQTTLTMMVKPGEHNFIDLTEVPAAPQGQNASEQLMAQQAAAQQQQQQQQVAAAQQQAAQQQAAQQQAAQQQVAQQQVAQQQAAAQQQAVAQQQAAAVAQQVAAQHAQHPVTPEPQKPVLAPTTAPQNLQNYDSARATAAGLLSFVFGNPNLNKQFLNFAEGNKDEHKSPLLSPKQFGYTPPSVSTPNMFLPQGAHNGNIPMLERMKAEQQQKLLPQNKLQQLAQQRHQSMLHPAPIHPSPIHPHSSASHYNIPNAMGGTDLKGLEKLNQEYQNAALQKNTPFDIHNDSPLKDCSPKVRASLVNGDIQLMWNIIGDERKCTGYKLFAYMGSIAPPISAAWTEVGTVKALPMPMAVTLSQFSKGCSYHFTVRAIDVKGNCGPFSEPCSIKLSI